MKMWLMLLLWAGPFVGADDGSVGDDPFLWLEAVTDQKALSWVEKQNEAALEVLTQRPEFEPLQKDILGILNSDERIALPAMHGPFVYNFWRDGEHPRGIWRRSEVESYLSSDPKWETVLDVDRLAAAENENWVYKNVLVRDPEADRALIFLSRGGADAVVMREFDLKSKLFVEGGFSLPEAKSDLSWRSIDEIYVGTDFGAGSLTESGYPRVAKIWKRGTPLASATTVFEGEVADVSIQTGVSRAYGEHHEYVLRAKTFFTAEQFLVRDEKLLKLDVPDDASLKAVFRGQLILELKSDWLAFGQGSLVAIDLEKFIEGSREFHVLVEPSDRLSVSSVSRTKDCLVVVTLDNVVSKIHQFRLAEGQWQTQLVDWEQPGSIAFVDHIPDSNQYFVMFTGFLTPSTLYLVDGDQRSAKAIKSLPAFFDASPYAVQQLQAKSADGTIVPYFTVMRKDAQANGQNPTLLYGYGGFEVSMAPRYSATVGKGWLERGGIYVVANIRGGGEFGPKWHQAALKKQRHKAFQDFIAVAEDLIQRKLTSPQKLAIRGGSNGGLLVGAVFTQRPELFAGVVCQVPLLDMKRFNRLLAGASWMGEYGNPDDPDMWSYIKTYSPYHNLKPNANYPKVLFTTSTRDDRVHPGHARKMVAKLQQLGYPVYYYENTEGGHAGAANNDQRAFSEALIYSYLGERLMSTGEAHL